MQPRVFSVSTLEITNYSPMAKRTTMEDGESTHVVIPLATVPHVQRYKNMAQDDDAHEKLKPSRGSQRYTEDQEVPTMIAKEMSVG